MKAKIASGAQAAIDTCGRYWPKKVCNCSTPSMIDSITPPVRSAPNQAGPRATILSYSRPRSASCTRAAVRCAIMVRRWSSQARSRMATSGRGQRQDQLGRRRAAEQPGEELAEKGEARDAETERQQPEHDGQRDAAAQTARHAPESEIEMHDRLPAQRRYPGSRVNAWKLSTLRISMSLRAERSNLDPSRTAMGDLLRRCSAMTGKRICPPSTRLPLSYPGRPGGDRNAIFTAVELYRTAMTDRIPPLAALRAFAAVARHGSFARRRAGVARQHLRGEPSGPRPRGDAWRRLLDPCQQWRRSHAHRGDSGGRSVTARRGSDVRAARHGL